MQLLVVLIPLVALSAGSAIPATPGDNSHYVQGESRYIWMPDDDGVPHMVDLEEPVPENKDFSRNGADNAYWLFTRNNPNNPQLIVHGNANSVWSSNYLASRPLVVTVHGWNGNVNSGSSTQIRNVYLAVQDANVIVLDWSIHAGGPYNSAASAVPSVGRFLGDFIRWLITTAGGNWNNVHIIGFSLGSHVVGNAGRQANGLAARVTGLDPASTSWFGNPDALNIQAAQYVEAIHTDGFVMGIFNPIAHADFYPNGGIHPQPGCNTTNCSHARAVDFFAATVQFNHLVGRLCTNLLQAQNQQCSGAPLNMGNAILTKRGRGMYGLTTGSTWPY